MMMNDETLWQTTELQARKRQDEGDKERAKDEEMNDVIGKRQTETEDGVKVKQVRE